VLLFKNLGSLSNIAEYNIELNTSISVDQRRYNASGMDQVAAIWMDGNDPQQRFSRSIIIYGSEDRPQYIRAYHGCYDPLAYPLLLPGGETGWEDKKIEYQDPPPAKPKRKYTKHKNQGAVQLQPLKKSKHRHPVYYDFNGEDHDMEEDSREEDGPDDDLDDIAGGGSRGHVSAREYYCFKLQIREGQFNVFFHVGRLFQQFAVDMYVKVESMRLDWYAKPAHQAIIRADLYQGLLDTLAAGEADASKAGLRVVLCKDFPGSDHDVQCRFMDADTGYTVWQAGFLRNNDVQSVLG